jgi:hypothetical protein
MERDDYFQSLLLHLFQIPESTRSPNNTKSHLSLKTLVKQHPFHDPPLEPLWREIPVFRAFLYISFRVPSKEPSLQIPLTELP